MRGIYALYTGYFLLGITALAGWVINIIDIFGSDFGNITGELVVRVIGVFVAPIGAIMGLFF